MAASQGVEPQAARAVCNCRWMPDRRCLHLEARALGCSAARSTVTTLCVNFRASLHTASRSTGRAGAPPKRPRPATEGGRKIIFSRKKKPRGGIAKTSGRVTKTFVHVAERFFLPARIFCGATKKLRRPANIFCDVAKKIILSAGSFFHAKKTFFPSAGGFLHAARSSSHASRIFRHPAGWFCQASRIFCHVTKSFLHAARNFRHVDREFFHNKKSPPKRYFRAPPVSP